MDHDFDLERFVDAQSAVFGAVRDELRAGQKRSHWMWYVFPQLAGLGQSAMARRYAIGALDEARAYVAHPVLGPRLLECTRLACGIAGRSARAVFGTPDDVKFRSSMTLFAHAAPRQPEFGAALDQFFGGQPDLLTLRLLG